MRRFLGLPVCLLLLLSTQTVEAQAKPPVRPRVTPRPTPRPRLSLPDLIKKFEAEKAQPYNVRYRTLYDFGQIRTDESARYVESIHKTDKDANIRRTAVTVLGTIGSPHARKVLMQLVDTSADASTRSSALQGLGRCKPKPKAEFFKKYAAKGQDMVLRNAAIYALSQYQDLDTLKYLLTLLEAPKQGADWPSTSQEGRFNQTILRTLQNSKQAKLTQVLVDEVLKKPTNQLVWHKKKLLPLVLRQDFEPYLETFQALLEEKDIDLRAAAVYGLDAKTLDDKRLKLLLECVGSKIQPVAVAGIIVVAKHHPKAALEDLLKVAKKKDMGRAASATEALGHYHDSDKAFKHLLKALKKKKPWQLVAAAIAGLKRCRRKDAVEALIKILPKLSGRLQADACGALEDLTGQQIGNHPKDWKNWWKAVSKTFEVPDAATVAKRKKESKGNVRGGTVSRNPSYYGTEVVSRRLTFIVDFSGSMSSKMSPQDPNSPTRLEKAKAELSSVIKGLSKGAFVNVIFFGTNFKLWQPTIVRANNRNKAAAIQTIANTAGMGGTNIYDPLEKALQDPNVDTIYLLSDGSPGSGKFTVPADILREVKKINASKRIVIHTISFGAKSKFLKDLAEQNGGRYIER